MSSTAVLNIRPGGSRRYEVGRVIIGITRAHLGHYTVTVEHASTGVIVDQLTSGPWTTTDEAIAAAGRAYRAFIGGRTVADILDMIDRAGRVLDEARRIVDAAAGAGA